MRNAFIMLAGILFGIALILPFAWPKDTVFYGGEHVFYRMPHNDLRFKGQIIDYQYYYKIQSGDGNIIWVAGENISRQ